MDYTIKKLAQLAGVSTRTLRYYDQIGLLKPSKINDSNYRIYNEKNVNKLQQILYYRSLDFPLIKIKQIMNDPNFSQVQALKEQRELLLKKQHEVNSLLANIDQTLKNYDGEIKMTDSEKFAAFKQEKITDNETKYGHEIRDKYGAEMINDSNEKFDSLTENDFNEMKETENNLISDLVKLKIKPDLDSALAKQIYQEHKKWLNFTWTNYTKKAHRGLVDLYKNDERFKNYYDSRAGTDVVQLLHDVVYHYTK
ncbi:MerR family transcriptional regulator [Companilactobacillus halodurans]|uniref:MerR family transcriptional regulator n=1 Tax=Companilactobacillus halodurans TaxID=2584183 RepID=A0A5P0ZY02_9LACO|nr:MerR family transcriptional regulator [Companilactobacillus halodurans]MQS76694.1 MerR family transcriptional regulator [Companilactobacillus halodurans]MQS97847.1 MerR family transcriptional regulator [Companilactobacillus halodurans]